MKKPATHHAAKQRTTYPFSIVLLLLLDAAAAIYLCGAFSLLLSRDTGNWAADRIHTLLRCCVWAGMSSCIIMQRKKKDNVIVALLAVCAAAAAVNTLFMREIAAAASHHTFLSFPRSRITTISSTELVLWWGVTGLVSGGIACTALGCMLGHAAHSVISPLSHHHHRSLTYWVLTAFILFSPPIVVPYHPICTAPPIISAVLALRTLFFSTETTTTAARKMQFSLHRMAAPALLTFALLRFPNCSNCRETRSTTGEGRAAVAAVVVVEKWRCELQRGGLLSVVEASPVSNGDDDGAAASASAHLRYRALRLDHSIMGGIWVHPVEFANQSIYTAFHLQAATRLLLHTPSTFTFTATDDDVDVSHRSLHIGLGVGTAVASLQQRGFTADVIELHPEIISVSQQRYFHDVNLFKSGRAHVFADDALRAVHALNSSAYDLIILDVFSGGAGASPLESQLFFRNLKKTLKAESENGGGGGVLAVNVVSQSAHGPGMRRVRCAMSAVFSTVRVFVDTLHDHENENNGMNNFVVVGSDSEKTVVLKAAAQREIEAIAAAADRGSGNRNEMEEEVLLMLGEHEVLFDGELGCDGTDESGSSNSSSRWRRWMMEYWREDEENFKIAVEHWKTMRLEFQGVFI